ncbi:MAG: CbiX/SirB N-terminal domain-containing protein [Microthrixaceae bacterium]
MSEPSTPAPVVVVLIVAHGSRNPRAAEEHERFCSLVAEAIGTDRVAQASGSDRVAQTASAGSGTGAASLGPGRPDIRPDGRPDVRPAYLELTEPSVATAIEQAVQDGATTIRMLPHFLNSGNHVLVDLPGAVDAARTLHPEVEISLDPHLGSDTTLVELTARKIAPPEEAAG